MRKMGVALALASVLAGSQCGTSAPEPKRPHPVTSEHGVVIQCQNGSERLDCKKVG